MGVSHQDVTSAADEHPMAASASLEALQNFSSRNVPQTFDMSEHWWRCVTGLLTTSPLIHAKFASACDHILACTQTCWTLAAKLLCDAAGLARSYSRRTVHRNFDQVGQTHR